MFLNVYRCGRRSVVQFPYFVACVYLAVPAVHQVVFCNGESCDLWSVVFDFLKANVQVFSVLTFVYLVLSFLSRVCLGRRLWRSLEDS